MSLQRDEVLKIAHLARLQLNHDEVELFSRQLGAIVDYVHLLHTVDTQGIEPFAHAVEISNVFRADEPANSLPADAALANAPARQGNFFRVPAVLE